MVLMCKVVEISVFKQWPKYKAGHSGPVFRLWLNKLGQNSTNSSKSGLLQHRLFNWDQLNTRQSIVWYSDESRFWMSSIWIHDEVICLWKIFLLSYLANPFEVVFDSDIDSWSVVSWATNSTTHNSQKN